MSPVGAEVRIELEADWLAEPWLATVRHADFERLMISRGQRLFVEPRRAGDVSPPAVACIRLTGASSPPDRACLDRPRSPSLPRRLYCHTMRAMMRATSPRARRLSGLVDNRR